MDAGLNSNSLNKLNLDYNMTSKIRIRNTKYLTTLGRIARGDTEAKVNEVITLYREGNISQIQTAENIIVDLIYNMKNKRQQKTTTKRYDKLIAKHKTKEPLNKRLTQSKTIKPFIIDVILYKFFSQDEDEDDEQFKQRKRRAKLYKKVYEQIGILSLNVKADEQILTQALDKLLEINKEVVLDDTSNLFHEMEKILKTNEQVAYTYWGGSAGISAIYLLNYKSDERKNKRAFVEPLDRKARDSVGCISMYSKYISTHLDVKYNNFKESIENKNYIQNECWINTLIDYYGETILSPDRSLRYRITWEKLLDILNVSEETIKQGLSVYQVIPFFEKYKCLKVFNEIGTLIFRYIPKFPNKSEKRC